MKNLLKKLGVLSLVTMILAPVIDLPKINAKENDCETHLQNYLFLDKNMFMAGEKNLEWVDIYSSEENGRTTSTYFLYSFPEETETTTVTVKSVEQYNFDDSSLKNDINKFWQYFNATVNTINGGRKYWDAAKNGDIFVEGSISNKYVDQAILLHGVWGEEFDSKGNYNLAFWDEIDDGEEYTLQKILTEEDRELLKATILASEENEDNKIIASDDLIDVDYFNDLIKNKTNVITDSEGVSIFPISLNRTIDVDSEDIDMEALFNEYVFGYTDEEGKQIIFTNDNPTNGVVQDSFTGLKESKYLTFENMKNEDGTAMTEKDFAEYYEDNVDFEVGEYYYWPVVLTVEYETCTLAEEEIKTWNLEYDGNVTDNSVKNIPDGSSANVGTSISVSAQKPEREGYKFSKWCEDQEGKSKCYDTNEKVTSDQPLKVTLYAQWAKVGTTDNEKTGVMSYVIGFLTIGLIAGGIYYIARKKNLFRQI